MSIIINKVAKRTPGKQEVKYYIAPRIVGRKTEKDLAERISRNTTLSEREAMMALAEVRRGVLDFLLDSYSVELSDWISLRPTLTSNGAETLKDCDANLVRQVNCRCTVSADFRAALQKAKFVDAKDLQSGSSGSSEG